MATKTISVEIDVYDRLVSQRSFPSESFSQVLRRARWDVAKGRAADILASLASLPRLNDEELAELDLIQAEDRPARDKWNS